MKIKKIYVYYIFVLLLWTLPLSANTLKLGEFLEEVKKQNVTIQSSKLQALAKKFKIKPSSTLDDPFVAFGLDEIPFKGGSAKIRRYQISQSFPFPGRLGAKSEIAETQAESFELDAQTIVRQVSVVATQVFLRASYNKNEILLNEKIQKIIQETVASAKARYRTGDASHHEWLLAKLELSVLNVELLRLKRAEKTLVALLNELRNRPLDSPLDVESDFFYAIDESQNIQADLENQPELQSLKAQQRSAEAEIKLAKLSYAPDFVIQGMIMEPIEKNSEMSQPSTWGVMVGVTLPLFFWRKQSELASAAEHERLAVLAENQSLQNRLNTEITDAKQQLQSSIDVVKLYKNEIIPITEIAVKNARTSYAAKTLPLRQLLDALRSQKIQELEFLAAQIDVVISQTRIRELLSNPPITKFAPSRPTLFGEEMRASSAVNMGAGMSDPNRKKDTSASSVSSESNMGGM